MTPGWCGTLCEPISSVIRVVLYPALSALVTRSWYLGSFLSAASLNDISKQTASSVVYSCFSPDHVRAQGCGCNVERKPIGSAADRGGGQLGQFAPGPQCEGAPNIVELFQIRSCSSFTSQSSFFKRFVSLDFKSACFFALRSRW